MPSEGPYLGLVDFPGSPQINNDKMQAANFMVFLRNVSNTFNQGHRGVTPLRHSATRYIIEIKKAEKLVIIWTVF